MNEAETSENASTKLTSFEEDQIAMLEEAETSENASTRMSSFEEDQMRIFEQDEQHAQKIAAPVLETLTDERFLELHAQKKPAGFQGFNNSCYLDTTLFAMFAMNNTYDYILTLPCNELVKPIQDTLRELVFDLRLDGYVHMEKKQYLREMMNDFFGDKPYQNLSWTESENDPVELISALFGEILEVPPFLSNETYSYSLLTTNPPENYLKFGTYQNIISRDYHFNFHETPNNLILRLPAIGESADKYNQWIKNIIPSLVLDLSDHLYNATKQCCICGFVATKRCDQCFGNNGENLSSVFFCETCLEKVHQNWNFTHHSVINIPDFKSGKSLKRVPTRTTLQLHAVICFSGHHYTCFVRDTSTKDGKWFYYNSMASHSRGEFLPRVKPLERFNKWASGIGVKRILEALPADLKIAENILGHTIQENDEVQFEKISNMIIQNPSVAFYHKPRSVFL